jgi:hypothetical protein
MFTASVNNKNSSANENISGTGLGETQIWVRKSTFDKSAKPENAELLLKEMVDWIENFISNNQTETAKLTLEQKQLYCAYHYAEYLRYGGHRLYLEKTAKRSSKIWSYVLSGLYVTGAIGHASNFRNMVFWATRNFDVFSNNVSIAADDEEVKKLDNMFLDLEERQPILETLAKWARSWEDLAILSDDASPDVMLQRKKIA